MSKRQTTRNRRGWKRLLFGGMLLALLAPAWLLLAPGPLGGSSSYVVTSGISMVPLFHSGDLAIVREASGYQVGDIVAYRDPDLGKVVLHRIVALDGERYVFQGDNNDFLDPYHPSRADFVGKLWLHVPRVGTLLAWVGTPRNAAVVGGALGLFVMGGFTEARARRRRRRRGQEGRPLRAPTPQLVPRRRTLPGLAAPRTLAVLSISTVAFVALGALAFSRPLDTPSSTKVSYEQQGAFSYSASGPRGLVYGGDALSTGDPVFLRLVHKLRVSFVYRLDAVAPHAASGGIGLAAELADATGWTHTIGIHQATVFRGDKATTFGTIDLASLQRLTAGVQQQTGVPQSQYTLTFTPIVHVNGTLAGQPVSDSFSPALGFVMNPLLLQLEPAGITSAGEAAANPLAPSRTGSVIVPGTKVARLSVLGHSLPVVTARWMAGWGACASLAALLMAAAFAFIWRPKDEPARIRAKYGNRLITVDATNQGISGATIVDVESMQALAMVAEGYDGMILALEQGGVHSYIVEGELVMYRYSSPRVGDRPDRRTTPTVAEKRLRPAEQLADPVVGVEARPARVGLELPSDVTRARDMVMSRPGTSGVPIVPLSRRKSEEQSAS